MADLYLTPAERYTAALGGFYYGDLPEPGTVYTQLIKDILNGTTPEKEPKNILARFIYSLYISDLGDPYPRYELAKLLYWKLHDITPTKSGSILTVTIDGEEDYMTINTDLSRLWYKVLFGSKTDVITEFPYIFNTIQNKLSDWELFGNTETSGTPTPQNPVDVNGTGGRTGNLFDRDNTIVKSLYIDSSIGTFRTSSNTRTVIMLCEPNTTYTISKMLSARFSVAYSAQIPASGDVANGAISNHTGTNITITTDNNARYLSMCIYNSAYDTATFEDIENSIMVNSGSTALPYEPYGIKIPILMGDTTNNVYLGEVEVTRKIKKYECTGDEKWLFYSDLTGEYGAWQFYVDNAVNGLAFSSALSNIAEYGATSPTRSRYPYGVYLVTSGTGIAFQMAGAKDIFPDVATWKSYLQQQYANSTPVTVWYVLATEETGIVNEPLMKIGDYTDSMSRTQTGIDIPTVIGQNTLDVLTTVKPSSMRIEYTSADETRSRSKRISLLKSPLKKGLIK